MKRIGLIFGLVLIISSLVSAQEETGWSITIEPVYSNLYGTDEHFGYIYSSKSVFLGIPRNQTLNYGTSSEPIVVEIPSTTQIILGLSYRWTRWPKWRLGIENGWHFKSSDDKSGLVSSDSINIRSVFMFGNALPPLSNKHNSPPRSDVLFWGKNSIRIRTFNIYLDLELNDILDITLSIKGASILSHHNVGQKQWVFIDDFRPWWKFDNEVTLAQDSKAKYLGIGPSIGFKFKTKYLAGSLEQGVLVGEARYFGEWDDNDKIVITNRTTSEVFATAFYNGQFPFKQIEIERVVIPNTEFRIKLTHLNFNFGVLVSTLWGVPIAPKWSIPGDWIPTNGLWSTQKRNLTFVGFTMGFEIGF